MGQYVARKRAKFKGFSGPVNIPWGAVLEEQDGLLCGTVPLSVGSGAKTPMTTSARTTMARGNSGASS